MFQLFALRFTDSYVADPSLSTSTNCCSIGLGSVSHDLCNVKSLPSFLSLCSAYILTSCSSICIALLTSDVFFGQKVSSDFFNESLCCRTGHWRVLHMQLTPSVHSILVSSVSHQPIRCCVCTIAQYREQVPRKPCVVSCLSDPSPLQCDRVEPVLGHIVLLLCDPLQDVSRVLVVSSAVGLGIGISVVFWVVSLATSCSCGAESSTAVEHRGFTKPVMSMVY